MGVTLKTPNAGSSQMLGTISAVVNPDVRTDIESDLVLEVGPRLGPLSLLIHR